MNSLIEIKNLKESFKKEYIYQLEYYKKELIKVNEESNQELIRFYTNRISEYLKRIDDIKYEINYMRDNNKEDLELREKIKKTYSKIIKESVPDNTNIVFFGINNLLRIKRILEIGIISTNEVNITYKDNIRNSLDDADNTKTSYLPYGAIFAIKPYNMESIKNTRINFKESQDRLYGIITTQENIIEIQNYCLENGIDINKVFTHEEFIKKSEDLFKEVTNKHSKK